jgi:hypothetical protein
MDTPFLQALLQIVPMAFIVLVEVFDRRGLPGYDALELF